MEGGGEAYGLFICSFLLFFVGTYVSDYRCRSGMKK
jgi:hypothetical protein